MNTEDEELAYPQEWGDAVDELMAERQEDEEELEEEVPEEEETPEAEPEEDDFPVGWEETVKEHWKASPKELRDFVRSREAEYATTDQKYEPVVKFAHSMVDAFRPYNDYLTQQGIPPNVAVQNILANDHMLRSGTPEQKFVKAVELLSSYGIDPAWFGNAEAIQAARQLAATNQPAPQQPPQRPVEDIVEERLALRDLKTQYDQFTTKEKREHLAIPEVKTLMYNLMVSGQAKDFESAYEQALWALPKTRQTLLSQQAKQEVDSRKAAVTTAKKAAGTSVKAKGRTPAPIKESMDDFISRSARELGIG